MRIFDVIRNAIPEADDGLCDHILWDRTPFPCGPITPRSLYSAAHRWRRAAIKGKDLCEFCDKLATESDSLCNTCRYVLYRQPSPELGLP